MACCLTSLAFASIACDPHAEIKEDMARQLQMRAIQRYIGCELVRDRCQEEEALEKWPGAMLGARQELATLESSLEEQMEMLQTAVDVWCDQYPDWKVWKSAECTYVVQGYGLGWKDNEFAVGSWYYYHYPDGRTEIEPACPNADSLLKHTRISKDLWEVDK